MKKILNFIFVFVPFVFITFFSAMHVPRTEGVFYKNAFAQADPDITTAAKWDAFGKGLYGVTGANRSIYNAAIQYGATDAQKSYISAYVNDSYDTFTAEQFGVAVRDRVDKEFAKRFPPVVPPPTVPKKSATRILFEGRYMDAKERADSALMGDASLVVKYRKSGLTRKDGGTDPIFPDDVASLGTGTKGSGGGLGTLPPPPPSTESNGLVPCGYREILAGEDPRYAAEDCRFEHFITLAKNVMNFLLFVIAIPIAAISFAWAGWLYLSAAGNESKVQEAHKIFGFVVLGLSIALAAWLIVNAIVIGLGVDSKYNFLGTT
jgi:hypothetical protein